jgi:hypothetical protein
VRDIAAAALAVKLGRPAFAARAALADTAPRGGDGV